MALSGPANSIITITQLEYVLAVYKFRHFGRAADNCHVSQPSLSAQIQKVEGELGYLIFDRSKKPIVTTEQGLLFIDQAKRVLSEHKRLLEVGSDSELSGEFRLGVIPTLSASIIPLFVERFSEKYPKVQLIISERQTNELVELLLEDQLDGGLLVTPLRIKGLMERPLFEEPFYAFVSDSHPLFKRKHVKESELSLKGAWLLSEGHCFREQMLKICTASSDQKVLANVQFSSGSMETLIELIRRGKGFTLLPYLTAQKLTRKEKLENLKPFSGAVPTREVSLVYSRKDLKSHILQALESEILKSLPANLPNVKSSHIVDI